MYIRVYIHYKKIKPTHVVPLPSYPVLQIQIYDPSVFVHVAF